MTMGGTNVTKRGSNRTTHPSTAQKALNKGSRLEPKKSTEEPVVQPSAEPNLDRGSVLLPETKDLLL